MKKPKDISVISVTDTISKELESIVEESFVVKALIKVIMNFDGDGIIDYKKTVHTLFGQGSYQYTPRKLDLDLKNKEFPQAKL